MGWLRDFIFKLLKITPAKERRIVIREPLSFRANVLRNQLWYRGDPSELEQFFKQAAQSDVERSRFWASVPQSRVRKIHSGLVAIVVDRYSDMVTADFNGADFGERDDYHPLLDRWNEIAGFIHFDALLGEAVAGVLSGGDGAFKLSLDSGEPHPVVSFYGADRLDFQRKGRRVTEICFYTPYKDGEQEFHLEERYGEGYVQSRLLDENGKEEELNRLAETAQLQQAHFSSQLLLAVPLVVFDSQKWPGRGKALFDSKTDNLDALDEVISQWLDAVRMGRVKRYIPSDMVPRNPDTGELMEANPFDNDYIAIGSSAAEGAQAKIDVSQPQISYEAYVNSYAAFMDLALQGVMSPATLGIDLKKTDNAEAQREKEKITMHIRGKIVDALNEVLPRLIQVILQADDLMHGNDPGEYHPSVSFGEYASPDFGSMVDTVVKARTGGVMSVEKAVEELYGDTMTEEEKQEEVARLKAEQGLVELEEPAVNLDGMTGGEGNDVHGGGGEEGLPGDGAAEGQPPEAGQ